MSKIVDRSVRESPTDDGSRSSNLKELCDPSHYSRKL
jgi:hypothetical protein